LEFLDIVEEALKRATGIQALRFDGTVGQRQRLHIQQRFKDSGLEVPLLMNAGAGAYSLNITDASIIIQFEIWWNLSVEWHICRVWRQTQTSEVLAIQLYSRDNAIDQEISKV
jgi:SNF2 family DNA or RNA helicase